MQSGGNLTHTRSWRELLSMVCNSKTNNKPFVIDILYHCWASKSTGTGWGCHHGWGSLKLYSLQTNSSTYRQIQNVPKHSGQRVIKLVQDQVSSSSLQLSQSDLDTSAIPLSQTLSQSVTLEIKLLLNSFAGLESLRTLWFYLWYFIRTLNNLQNNFFYRKFTLYHFDCNSTTNSLFL